MASCNHHLMLFCALDSSVHMLVAASLPILDHLAHVLIGPQFFETVVAYIFDVLFFLWGTMELIMDPWKPL